MKIAVLDDWQENARQFADFTPFEAAHELVFFSDTISGQPLIDRLLPFDILLVMRERTLFSADVIEQLPNLKLIVTSGMRNAALDLDSLQQEALWCAAQNRPAMQPQN